jgi:hypothetical protein
MTREDVTEVDAAETNAQPEVWKLKTPRLQFTAFQSRWHKAAPAELVPANLNPAKDTAGHRPTL